MIAYAPVVPPGSEPALPPDLRAHFCFALENAQDGYYEWYENKPGLVLDCPIYEGLPNLSPRELQRLGKQLNPRFLIIPDVRHSWIETIKLMNKYLEHVDLPSATGVIQGQNWDEVKTCVSQMLDAGVRKFAVPKDIVVSLCVDRLTITNSLLERGYFDARTEIHWLGADWPYTIESIANSLVKSFDCAEAANAALSKRNLNQKPPTRPADFMEAAPRLPIDYLWTNIKQIRTMVGDTIE